jgi:hypothetical protein
MGKPAIPRARFIRSVEALGNRPEGRAALARRRSPSDNGPRWSPTGRRYGDGVGGNP